eukprot:SAG31_NODE_14796_length_787_cov_1.030523_1_plen_89_part_01
MDNPVAASNLDSAEADSAEAAVTSAAESFETEGSLEFACPPLTPQSASDKIRSWTENVDILWYNRSAVLTTKLLQVDGWLGEITSEWDR